MVAPPTSTTTTSPTGPWPGEELDAGQDDVGRGAADHGREGVCPWRARLDRCLPPITWDRKTSRIAARADSGRQHPDLWHHVVGEHVGTSPGSAATSSRASTLPATTTGPGHPPSTSPGPPAHHLAVAAVGAAGEQHHVGRVAWSGRGSCALGRPRATVTTLPPLESATRRPASAVTSSSLPTTAIRSPPPALEQASTSASSPAGRRRTSRPGRRRTRRGRRSRWWCGARRRPRSGPCRGRRASALVKVEPKSTQTASRLSAQPRAGRGRRSGRRRSRCRR